MNPVEPPLQTRKHVWSCVLHVCWRSTHHMSLKTFHHRKFLHVEAPTLLCKVSNFSFGHWHLYRVRRPNPENQHLGDLLHNLNSCMIVLWYRKWFKKSKMAPHMQNTTETQVSNSICKTVLKSSSAGNKHLPTSTHTQKHTHRRVRALSGNRRWKPSSLIS